MEEHSTAVDFPVEKARETIHQYGLGLLFAANIFGAGSVYILTQAGVNFGFGLLWVLPLALGVGLTMHEMSARLAARNEPLMDYIRGRDRADRGQTVRPRYRVHHAVLERR